MTFHLDIPFCDPLMSLSSNLIFGCFLVPPGLPLATPLILMVLPKIGIGNCAQQFLKIGIGSKFWDRIMMGPERRTGIKGLFGKHASLMFWDPAFVASIEARVYQGLHGGRRSSVLLVSTELEKELAYRNGSSLRSNVVSVLDKITGNLLRYLRLMRFYVRHERDVAAWYIEEGTIQPWYIAVSSVRDSIQRRRPNRVAITAVV